MLESNCHEPLETTEEMTATKKCSNTFKKINPLKNIATMFHERLMTRTHAKLDWQLKLAFN